MSVVMTKRIESKWSIFACPLSALQLILITDDVQLEQWAVSGKTNLRQLLDIRRMKITQILLAHTKHTDYSADYDLPVSRPS